MLSNLLQVQVEERYGVEDVKKCEWFKSVDWNEVFLKKVEPPKITFRQTEPKEKLNEYDFTSGALGIGALTITSDDQVILMKRSSLTGECPNQFDRPGGHPEPDNALKVLLSLASDRVPTSMHSLNFKAMCNLHKNGHPM